MISYFLVSIATKGSIFSHILAASAVITPRKLVAYPGCTQASKSASIAFVSQSSNASACLLHSSRPWILDFGASDHISSNKNIFSPFTSTSPLPMVTLANGSQTIVKGIGSACPLPSLLITSILYVLDSPFNLISISKLTRGLNCLVIFSDHSVTLQDRSTGRRLAYDVNLRAFFILTRLHLPLLALLWILPSLFTILLVIRTFQSFKKWFLVFLVCPQLNVSHVILENILVSQSQST